MLFIVYQGKRKMNTFVVPILSVFVLLSGVSGEKYLEKTQYEIININNYLTYLWVVIRHGIPYGGRIDDLFELYLANISFFWNWLFLHYEIRFWIIFSSFRSTVHILFYVLLLCWLRCVNRHASVSIDMSYRQAEFLKTTRFC